MKKILFVFPTLCFLICHSQKEPLQPTLLKSGIYRIMQRLSTSDTAWKTYDYVGKNTVLLDVEKGKITFYKDNSTKRYDIINMWNVDLSKTIHEFHFRTLDNVAIDCEIVLTTINKKSEVIQVNYPLTQYWFFIKDDE